MNLFSLLPGVLQTVGKVLGIGAVQDAGTLLQTAHLSPEQQTAIQEALLAHEVQLKQLSIDEMKAAMAESLTMLASPDKYVARARPTGLYAFYAVSTAVAVGLLAGVKVDPTAILTVMAPLAGVSGTYVYQRTQEKIARNGNGTH